MTPIALGRSGLTISPVVFGGNVFGWTLDEAGSFDMLDRMVQSGITTIDTADGYSRWVEGHEGGESETIIGNWFAIRPGMRDKVQLITKVGTEVFGGGGLSKDWITTEVEQSLKRLQTDRIDLYFSHFPDDNTPHEETLAAYETLIKAGKVRAIGASNFTVEQLRAAQSAAEANSLPAYDVIQPEYNLYARERFEGPIADFAQAQNLGVIPYFALAAGFLTGKYRTEADLKGPRGERSIGRYMNKKGQAILAAMDSVAEDTGASHAAIALAWMRQRPGVTAPIASATSATQFEALVEGATLNLSHDAINALTKAGA